MFNLERFLIGIQTKVEPFAVCEVRGDAVLHMGTSKMPTIHYVLAGRGSLSVPGRPDYPLDTNTMAIVPANLDHSVAVEPYSLRSMVKCGELVGGWRRIREGYGNSGIMLACGEIEAMHRHNVSLFMFLDEPIISNIGLADRTARTMETLLDEIAKPQPGTRALAASMLSQILILIIRDCWEKSENNLSWCSALEDDRLGRVVAAMAADLSAQHTVESLAVLAGMSRSAFARHFKEQFARSPMNFLTELRLRDAARLIEFEDYTVKAAAHKVGFSSRSYFSRAYKKHFGTSPDHS